MVQQQSTSSDAQRLYYTSLLVPMWRGQLDQLTAAMRSYRQHLLAVECLRRAKGDGADPLRIAEFCKAWKTPLTLPIIGPTALLRRLGKIPGLANPSVAAFDPAGAIYIGIKILAQMVPLFGRIQVQNAVLIALDEKVVDRGDQTQVASILQSAVAPQILLQRVKESKDKLTSIWEQTVTLAQKMEPIREELGLPELL